MTSEKSAKFRVVRLNMWGEPVKMAITVADRKFNICDTEEKAAARLAYLHEVNPGKRFAIVAMEVS